MYCYDLEQRATELNNLHQNHKINSIQGGSGLCQANLPKQKTLKDFKTAASEMLHRKYDTQFQFYFARPVNELLQNLQTPAVVQFKEWYFIDDSYEYLKRFYKKTEQNQRIVQLVALYQKLLPPFSPAFFCKSLGGLMLERRREIAILFVKTVYHKKQHQQSTKHTEQESHQNEENLLDMLDETSLLAESIQNFSIRERTKSKHIGNVPKLEQNVPKQNNKNDQNNQLIKIQEHGQYETTEISSPRRRERISPSKQKSDNMLKLSAQKLSASPEKTERTRRAARETERRGGQDIIQNKQKSAEKQDGCKQEIRRARSNQLNEQSAGIFTKLKDEKITGTNEQSRDNLPDKLIDSNDKNRNQNTVDENDNNNHCIQLGSFVYELAKAEANSKNNSLESISYDIFNPSFSVDGLLAQFSDSLDNLNEQLLASRPFQTNISDSIAEKYILILSQTSGKIQNSQSQHVPSQNYINGENSICNIWGMSSQRNTDWMKIKQSLELNNRSISTGHVSSRFDHTGDNRTSQIDNSQNFLSPTEYLLDRYLMGSSSTKQEHNNTDFDDPNGEQEHESQQQHYLLNTQESKEQLDSDQSSFSKRTAVELKLLGRLETKKWDESQLKQEQRAFWSQWEKLKQELPKNHKLTQQITQTNEIKNSNSNTNSQPQLNSYNSLFSSSAGIAGEINSQTASCSNKTTTSSNKTASSYHQMSTSWKSLIPNKLTPTTPTNQQQIYQQISANGAHNSQTISALSSFGQYPQFINKMLLSHQNSNENEGQNPHDKKELPNNNNNNNNVNGNPSTPLNYFEDNIDDKGYSPKLFSLKLHPIQCDDHFNVQDDRRQSSMPDLNEYGQKSKNVHRMQLQQFSQHSCLQKQKSNGQNQIIGKNQNNNNANRQTQPNMMIMMNQGILNNSKQLSKSAVSQQQQQQQQQSRHFLTNFVKSANQMHSSQIVKSPSVYIPSNQSNLTVAQRNHNPTSKSIHVANTYNNNNSNSYHNNSNISKISKVLPKTKKPNNNKSNTFISAFAECLASEQQSLISSSSASPNLMCLSTPSPCLTAQHFSAPSPTSASGMTQSKYPTLQQSNSTPESNNLLVKSTETISNKSTSNLRNSIEESRSMNQQNYPLMSHYFSTANLFFKQSSPSNQNDTAQRVQQLQQQSEQGKQQQQQLTSKFQQLSQLRLSIEGNCQSNSNSQNKPNDAGIGIVQSQSLHVASERTNISRPKISGINVAAAATTVSHPGLKSSRDYYQLSRKESKSSTSSCLLGSTMIPKNINSVITKLSTPHYHHRSTHSVKDNQGIMMLSEEQQTPSKQQQQQQHHRQRSLYRQNHNKQSNSCVSLEELGGELDQQQQFNSSNNSYGFLTSRSSGRKITEKMPLANSTSNNKTCRSNINESPYHLSAVESFNKHRLKIKQAEQNEKSLKQQQQNQIGNEQKGFVTENDYKNNQAIAQRKSSVVVPSADARLTFKRYSHDIVQSSCSGLSQKLFGKQVQEKELQNQVKQPQQRYQSQNTLEKQQEMCLEQLGGQQMEENMESFQQEQRQVQIYQELIQHIKNSNANNNSNRHSYQIQKQQQQQQQQNTKMNKKQ